MSGKCQEHYPAEMDEAINAGACPVCLRRALAEALELLREVRQAWVYDNSSTADDIDAFLERKP